MHTKIFLSIIIAGLLVACKGGHTNSTTDANTNDSLAVANDSQIVFDSVVYNQSDKYLDYKANIVWPTAGDSALRQNLCKIILANIGEKNPTGKEDLMAVLKKQFELKSKNAKSESSEFENAKSSPTVFSYYDELKVSYSNKNVITFCSNGYEYTGGAHGLPWRISFTVDLATGKQLRWADIIKPSKMAQLKPLLKQEIIKQYFKGENDALAFEFDLPTIDPSINAEGVCFEYLPYDIASYADGMPVATLTKEQLKEFLTDYASSLLDAIAK